MTTFEWIISGLLAVVLVVHIINTACTNGIEEKFYSMVAITGAHNELMEHRLQNVVNDLGYLRVDIEDMRDSVNTLRENSPHTDILIEGDQGRNIKTFFCRTCGACFKANNQKYATIGPDSTSPTYICNCPTCGMPTDVYKID